MVMDTAKGEDKAEEGNPGTQRKGVKDRLSPYKTKNQADDRCGTDQPGHLILLFIGMIHPCHTPRWKAFRGWEGPCVAHSILLYLNGCPVAFQNELPIWGIKDRLASGCTIGEEKLLPDPLCGILPIRGG